MPNIAYMSVLFAALLVWLVGVPVGFWLLTAIYPARLRQLLRKSARLQPVAPWVAPVPQLVPRADASPVGARHELG